jgi:peptidoglycan/LPS O-acetylase OafA/YrhL
MVHAAGTSLSLGIGRGYFSGGGSVTAIGVSSSATNLARRVGPRQTYAWVAALLLGVLCLIIWVVVLGPNSYKNDIDYGPLIVVSIASVLFFIAVCISEQRRITPLMEKWQRSYLCLRCGNIFEESLDTGLWVQ